MERRSGDALSSGGLETEADSSLGEGDLFSFVWLARCARVRQVCGASREGFAVRKGGKVRWEEGGVYVSRTLEGACRVGQGR